VSLWLVHPPSNPAALAWIGLAIVILLAVLLYKER
jgi:hypothetical protein